MEENAVAKPDDGSRGLGTPQPTNFVVWAIRSLAFAGALALFMIGAVPAFADPPTPPAKLAPIGNAALDSVYYGAVPPGSTARPVLLFVHGLGGIASDWWVRHDMYVTAYNAGYRTAFVSLNTNGQRGPSQNQFVNGRTLSPQIFGVAHHYGVDKVDIIAHSKGGVDAQTAIVHFGAASRVRNVFTLGAPHHGTQLADVPLFNALFTWLESQGIGNDEGLHSVRTDVMRAYRAVTDPRSAQLPVRYFTGAGDGGRPGSYLASFGPNDGLVTVDNTKLPGPEARTMRTGPYTHFELMSGSKTFAWIREVLEAPAP